MTVTNRYLSVLLCLAAILLAATIAAYVYEPTPASGFVKDSPLIQGLDLPQVSRIKVRAEGKEVTLTRQGERFVVAERDNYPASTARINDLLLKVLDIHRHEKVSDSPAGHQELNVADDGKGTRVELIDKDGKVLATLFVGAGGKDGGNYVRLASDKAIGNTVYATSQGLWLTADPVSYLQTRLVDAPKDDIVRVTVKDRSGDYVISRDKDNKPRLENVPAGKRVKQDSDVNAVFEALPGLDCEDVTRDGKDIVWGPTYACELKGHLTYTLRLGKRQDKQYIAMQAAGPAQDVLENLTIAKDDSKAELARKDAILQAAGAAKTFNDRHKDWFYQLSEFKAKELGRPLAELIEDTPPATKPATKPASHTTASAPKRK